MSSVLVLLASYNGGPWLIEQVDSIFGQSNVSVSLLIGDDCSTDRGLESLKADARMRVLNFTESSGGAGQNFLRLLRESDLVGFDFLAFSDQDDVWHSDKLDRAISKINASGASGYSSAVIAYWPDGTEKVLRQNPSQTDLDFLFEGAGQGCTFVLKGDFARLVQLIVREHSRDVSLIHYHDWLIYALSRVLNRGWYFDDHPCMRYRQHGGNDTGARVAIAGVMKRVRLIRTGWYLRQVRQVFSIVNLIDNSSSLIPLDFKAVWLSDRGFTRRIKLAGILLFRGRRRFSDRVVLSVSALLGWL